MNCIDIMHPLQLNLTVFKTSTEFTKNPQDVFTLSIWASIYVRSFWLYKTFFWELDLGINMVCESWLGNL